MTKPRIHLLALGGTIAMQPGDRGMKVGLGADELVGMAPGLNAIADIQAATISRVGSSDLALDASMRWQRASKQWPISALATVSS